MAHKSSVHGVFVNSTGWTGRANPVTAGNEAIHAELAKNDVYLMQGGLLAKRLGVKGSLKNPYPNGHEGLARRRMLDLYVHDPINEMEELI